MVQPGEGRVGVGGSDSRAGCDCRYKLDESEIGGGEIDGREVGNNEVRNKVQKTSKSRILSKSKKTVGSDFFTLEARLTFTILKHLFVKASIPHHFDLKCPIRVEKNVSGYAIDGIVNQLTLDNLGQLRLVTFFSRKIILVETE